MFISRSVEFGSDDFHGIGENPLPTNYLRGLAPSIPDNAEMRPLKVELEHSRDGALWSAF